MKFMILVKASKESEAGEMPSTELMRDMGNFNEELVKAGVMLAGEGLQPTSKGARVRFSGKDRTVMDGPFTETKELIAGYWIWQVKSLAEAIAWVKRCQIRTAQIPKSKFAKFFRPKISVKPSLRNCRNKKSGCAQRRVQKIRLGDAPQLGRKERHACNTPSSAITTRR